tara:strand:- start:303 stop:1046 length:744 start_codon:yes stop_codon:yes gene_type:complete
LKISIITICYNAARTVEKAVKSVLSQTYPDVEYIVVDGNSTDHTLKVLNRYKQEIDVLISEPDKGLYDAINKGIQHASGDYIGLVHADDSLMTVDVIEKVAEQLKAAELPDVLYGDIIYSKPEGKIFRNWKAGVHSIEKWKTGWMTPHTSLFIKRSRFKDWGNYRLDLGTAADYELMLRYFVKHKCSVIYLPEYIVNMQVGGASNVSVGNRLKANKSDLKAWEINEIKPHPMFRLLKPLRKFNQIRF